MANGLKKKEGGESFQEIDGNSKGSLNTSLCRSDVARLT